MRLINNKKGQVRVIEAFFASILLISCVSLIPAQPDLQSSNSSLSWTAQNVLLSLDSNGHMAKLIDNRDWTSLRQSVESVLPLTIWFNLTVFDQNMNCLNDYPLNNAGAVSDKVVSYDYMCASPNSQFTIYILRLQLSVVD